MMHYEAGCFLMPSSTYPIRRELRARVYQALID